MDWRGLITERFRKDKKKKKSETSWFPWLRLIKSNKLNPHNKSGELGNKLPTYQLYDWSIQVFKPISHTLSNNTDKGQNLIEPQRFLHLRSPIQIENQVEDDRRFHGSTKSKRRAGGHARYEVTLRRFFFFFGLSTTLSVILLKGRYFKVSILEMW